MCEKFFGITIQNTLKDWFCHLDVQPWMTLSPFQPMKESLAKDNA